MIPIVPKLIYGEQFGNMTNSSSVLSNMLEWLTGLREISYFTEFIIKTYDE